MGSLRGRSTVAWCVAALFLLPAPSRAYTPDSPEVQKLVAKGLEYLGSQDPEAFSRLGNLCLAGLCFVKAGQPEHPTVKAAIKACRELTAKGPNQITTSVCDIYSSGLVIIFLSSVDGSAYRQEIGVMVRSLELRQLTGGAWTYESLQVGDTSMTQYGALGMWEASAAGYAPPIDRVARILGWLMRTQDIGGGWGYHAEDPGSFQLLEQSQVRLSLVTAALGSIYLCSDLLELSPGVVQAERDLPAALRPVEPKGGRARVRIDRAQLRLTLRNGTAWFNRAYQIDPEGYTHYYLYSLERYQSLREVAERRVVAEPAWYNQGVEYLARTQAEDGSWTSNSGQDADTAFAVLFLLRSMKKSIQKARNFGDGTLTGGRGLPSNSADAELKQGRVVSRKLTGPATGLLEILNDPNHPDILYLADNLDQVNPTGKGGLSASQRAELDRVAETGSVEARLIALRALARARDLDNVPRLIAALRDPDWRVVQEANTGLARMARRLGGFELPDQADEAAREKLITRWKAWYRTARPEAEFADDPP